MFSYLMPVFGALLAVPLLGEPIAPYHIIGGVLVFGGIVLANQHQTVGRIHAVLPRQLRGRAGATLCRSLRQRLYLLTVLISRIVASGQA